MRLAEKTSMIDGIEVKNENILTFCHHLQQNLQPDVTLFLKCLTQAENMAKLDSVKIILVQQYLQLYDQTLKTYRGVTQTLIYERLLAQN